MREALARRARTFGATCAPLALLLLGGACSGAHDEPSQGASAAPQASGAPLRPVARDQSAALVALRRHLDRGELDRAEPLLSAAASAGDEAALLAARAAALSGRNIDALRLIETARAKNPRDPSVYATAAEIYALNEKFESGWAEIHQGEQQCGSSPELLRAKGVLWILREGGARKGLEYLEQALAADPTIPFIDHALSQAHLLLGKESLKGKDLDRALSEVRAALAYNQDDVDAQRLLSDVFAARMEFASALKVLEQLVAAGQPLEAELATLYKRAGIAALLAHRREEALSHFVAARAHGLTDAELSSGARILSEEALARMHAGIEAYDAQDLAAAEARLREALVYDPDLLAAENHLAVVLFRKQALPEAIELWRRVLRTARAENLALPEPVHINLAKAEFQAGDLESARVTLEEYLDREPFGEWVEKTRDLLELLPPPQPQPR